MSESLTANKPKKFGVPAMGSVGDMLLDDVPALETCNPGLRMTEYNVLIAPAIPKKKVGSIYLAEETHEKMSSTSQLGRIVAVSPLAFTYATKREWADAGGSPPQVGDLVLFARYGGAEITGLDGNTYRQMKDKDIGSIVDVEDK